MARGIESRHVGRYREIATILAEEGLGAAAIGLGLPEALRGRHPEPDSTVPERIRHALERMGPAAVKVGQMLSTRPDLLPEEFRVELQRLQDRVTPVSFEQIADVIEAELGAPPERIFARFDREPFASASIGQVHAAELIGGGDVVVKVQRPDILVTVETDLDIMRTQARRLAGSGIVPPSLDLPGIAEEFANAVRRELDYISEASNVERFAQAFADDETVVVPRVYREYSTKRVLTLERLYGIPFNRPDLLDEARIDRHDLANRGVSAYLTQIFRAGMFHADPHPGNIFALPSDRVGFTDFGRVGLVPPGVSDATSDILVGIVDRDVDLVTDALVGMSRDPGRLDAEYLRRELSVLIGKYHGTQLGGVRVGELVEDLLDLVRKHQLGMPSEFAMLMATMAVLEGVGQALDPRFDFVEVARPYADEMLREQFKPSELSRKLLRVSRRLVRAASDLPSSIDRALERVAEGEFRVAVRPEGYERMFDRAEELADRLAFAVLIASFVIGITTLLSAEGLPRWFRALLYVGLFGAVIVSGWLFASLLLARWRGRRTD